MAPSSEIAASVCQRSFESPVDNLADVWVNKLKQVCRAIGRVGLRVGCVTIFFMRDEEFFCVNKTTEYF